MKDVTRLVETVRDFSRQLEDRHGAFGALVKRYQDMAFGCAYAVLGDFYLAEDCAQEAFITAWQSIAQLRTPEAFSGWLRRIVLTKCNRLTRGRRLHIVPLELGQGVPSKTPDPQSVVERRDVSGRVLAAIQALPDNERIATTLFYVNGYTQVEIGEFLDIPETTVNKRLYSARQRLKQKETVAQFRTDLRHHRPSRDESFADKLSARLRPFADQDWPVVSTMTSAAKEGDEKASEDWLRKRKEFKEASYVRRHYIAEHAKNGRLLGYGSIEQSVFLPRYRLILVVDPRWLERGVGELLLERLTKDLIDVGAVIVSFRDYQSANEVQQFLKKHGFTETTRVNDMRLEVKLFDVSKFARSLERVQEQEIKISTLAAERISDPHYIEKLYRLTSELSLDDPGRSSFAPAAYYEREARLWLEQPYVLPDGYFIAKDQDQYIGLTDINLFDALPGGASFGFTGVKREYRRRGIATAMKVCAIAWAQKQNFQMIRAVNRTSNSALLALNKKLGFVHKVSYVTLEKLLKQIAAIDTKLYDVYEGRYQDSELRPELIFTVKNEGGRLTLECVGQKVELFPESDTKFFCTPFYGEFNFVRGDRGEVMRLDSRVRGLNQPESVLHAKKTS